MVLAVHMSALKVIEKSIFPYKRGISAGLQCCLDSVEPPMPNFMFAGVCALIMPVLSRGGYAISESGETGGVLEATVWDGWAKGQTDFDESKLVRLLHQWLLKFGMAIIYSLFMVHCSPLLFLFTNVGKHFSLISLSLHTIVYSWHFAHPFVNCRQLRRNHLSAILRIAVGMWN